MVAAEALRLAAVEALCPTASKTSDTGWPTLARHRVYDSAAILPDDLEADQPYTPCLSLYTDEAQIERRGDGSSSSIGFATSTLTIVVELAAASQDEGDQVHVLPFAEDDARARLVLGALCAQVRKVLVYSESGSHLRKIMKSVERLRIESFSMPQLDLRFMRNTMLFTCAIRDDQFSDAAGLPEPARSLMGVLPEGSYALAKLTELDAVFAATTRTALNGIRFSTTGNPAAALPEGSAT